MTSEREEIKKLQETISELQAELKFLQETVGVLMGAMIDEGESEEFFGSEEPYLPLASRSDVLVFQTDPLIENTEITGPVSVRLWVSSSAVDTDFTAKLIDGYPASSDYPE